MRISKPVKLEVNRQWYLKCCLKRGYLFNLAVQSL